MQIASRADDLKPRPDVKVVGIAEDDLRAHLEQFTGIQRLDAALRAHRHERGRIDNATSGGQTAQAGPRMGIGLK